MSGEEHRIRSTMEAVDTLVAIALREGWNAAIEECKMAIAGILEGASVDMETISIVNKIGGAISALTREGDNDES